MAHKLPFRNRAQEVTRLEAFSDIVFGFALTLIVVALEVPKTFAELMHDIRGFFGFAICFALLVWLWHCHYTFSRRYDLQDPTTIFLNTLLLFVVLFYVYPLKFLFSLLTGGLGRGVITRAEWPTLMYIYGIGSAGIFTIFFLMYLHAWRKRDELELNAVERHDTRTQMALHGSYVGISLGSILLTAVLPDTQLMWAGWIYGLMGPVSGVIGAKMGIQRDHIADQMLAPPAPEPPPEPPPVTATAAT